MTTPRDRAAERPMHHVETNGRLGRIARWAAAVLVATVFAAAPSNTTEAVGMVRPETTDTTQPPDEEPVPEDTEPTPSDAEQEPAEPADVPVVVWIGAGIVVAAAIAFAVRGVRGA